MLLLQETKPSITEWWAPLTTWNSCLRCSFPRGNVYWQSPGNVQTLLKHCPLTEQANAKDVFMGRFFRAGCEVLKSSLMMEMVDHVSRRADTSIPSKMASMLAETPSVEDILSLSFLNRGVSTGSSGALAEVSSLTNIQWSFPCCVEPDTLDCLMSVRGLEVYTVPVMRAHISLYPWRWTRAVVSSVPCIRLVPVVWVVNSWWVV